MSYSCSGRSEPLLGSDGKEITDDQIFVDLDKLDLERSLKASRGDASDGADVGEAIRKAGNSKADRSNWSTASGSSKRRGFSGDAKFTGARFKSQKVTPSFLK